MQGKSLGDLMKELDGGNLKVKVIEYEKALKEIKRLSSYYIDDQSIHGIASDVLNKFK